MAQWIIVGAGSAGCVLANRLSEDPDSSVVLIEAGPADKKKEISIPVGFTALPRTEVDWEYWTLPEQQLNGRKVFHPRGKTLGGSSSINAMVFQRGHRADFDHWAGLGNAGWGFEDVLPYFKKLENWEGQPSALRGTGGPLNVANLCDPNPISLAFVEAAQEIGIPVNPDYNGNDSEGASLAQVNQRKAKRCSSSVAYLRPALKRPNLQVITGAQATRIVFEGRRATGVAFRREGKDESITADREIILCAGAFNSPHLLMASGIGPADHLKEEGVEILHGLPGVGQNLQDHLMVLLKYECTQPITLLNATKLGSLVRYLLSGKGLLTSNVCEFVAFLRTQADLAGPDLELAAAPAFFDILKPPDRHAFSVGSVLLQPESIGEVRLASREPLEKPLVQQDYLSDAAGADLQLLIKGVKLSRQLASAKPLDPYRGEELVPGAGVSDDESIESFIREAAETIYHPVGTCKMGNDPMAVVDSELRVHGIECLRVVDASIMPRIVRAHTHATVVMIAEKAADLIHTHA